MRGKANKSELKRIIWSLDESEYDYIIEPHDDENVLSIEKKVTKHHQSE